MRTETRDPTNAAFAAGDVFACKTAPQVTITAPTVEESRIMSLHEDYQELNVTVATAVVATPATDATNPTDTTAVTVNVKDVGTNNLANKQVTAASDDTDIVTVEPAALTDTSGNAYFTITSVGAGVGTVTFTCNAATDTTVVTVTTP